MSQSQQSNNSSPCTLGPYEQERHCPKEMSPVDGESS